MQPLAVAIADAVEGRGMIQTNSSSKPAGLSRGDHQAAASARPVILSGEFAGHRITTAEASMTKFKPA